MDENLLALILFVFFGALLIFLVKSNLRKNFLNENKGKSLFTVFCTVTNYYGIFAYGSFLSLFSKRVSFYNEYFVVAGISKKKYYYSDIKYVSFRRSFFSKSIAIGFNNRHSLVLHTKDLNKIDSILKPRIPKTQ